MQLDEMKIEQNTLARDWTVLHNGRRFFVNFRESDGQTLTLCNRNNWQIHEETEESIKELTECVFHDSEPQELEQAQEDAEIIDELIGFCVADWDNKFMKELQKDLKEQSQRLAG